MNKLNICFKGKFFLKNIKFNIHNRFNKLKFIGNPSFEISHRNNLYCLKYNSFSSDENKIESDDIHNDFKPKIKTEINNENVMKTIDEWVKGNDVLIFMKGTREMPRCGFSNYVVQILNFYKIKNVKVVNVLENQLVRESVKEYSNWPTFPQLYVKSNLIGGCDIIREMHDNGTFKELVEREGIATE